MVCVSCLTIGVRVRNNQGFKTQLYSCREEVVDAVRAGRTCVQDGDGQCLTAVLPRHLGKAWAASWIRCQQGIPMSKVQLGEIVTTVTGGSSWPSKGQ
jgi:hypothetical protein